MVTVSCGSSGAGAAAGTISTSDSGSGERRATGLRLLPKLLGAGCAVRQHSIGGRLYHTESTACLFRVVVISTPPRQQGLLWTALCRAHGGQVMNEVVTCLVGSAMHDGAGVALERLTPDAAGMRLVEALLKCSQKGDVLPCICILARQPHWGGGVVCPPLHAPHWGGGIVCPPPLHAPHWGGGVVCPPPARIRACLWLVKANPTFPGLGGMVTSLHQAARNWWGNVVPMEAFLGAGEVQGCLAHAEGDPCYAGGRRGPASRGPNITGRVPRALCSRRHHEAVLSIGSASWPLLPISMY